MGKFKEHKEIVTLILVILGVAFYWYEWRPFKTRETCAKLAYGMTIGYGLGTPTPDEVLQKSLIQSKLGNPDLPQEYDLLFRVCLEERGQIK